MICDFHNPELWPSAAHRLILQAALLDGAPAIDAWRRWQSENALESADSATFELLPGLYLNLRRLVPNAPELETLRGMYKYTWCRNQIALRSVMKVVQVLDRAGIWTAVLKGIPLILDHYADAGARMMADIDLLIDERDREKADAALRASGWTRNYPWPPQRLVPYLAECHYEQAQMTEVDLHWHSFSIYCPQPAEQDFRARLTPRDILGVTTCVPDPTDNFLLTCIHSRKNDGHTRARWVMDAMTVFATASPAIDWNELLERARQVGMLMPVRDSLAYLRSEFGLPVPSDILDRAANQTASLDDLRRYAALLPGGLSGLPGGLSGRGLMEQLAMHWWQYSSVCRVRGHKPSLGQFPNYYVTVKQWEWQLPSRWRVVPRAAVEVTRNLLGLTRAPKVNGHPTEKNASSVGST